MEAGATGGTAAGVGRGVGLGVEMGVTGGAVATGSFFRGVSTTTGRWKTGMLTSSSGGIRGGSSSSSSSRARGGAAAGATALGRGVRTGAAAGAGVGTERGAGGGAMEDGAFSAADAGGEGLDWLVTEGGSTARGVITGLIGTEAGVAAGCSVDFAMSGWTTCTPLGEGMALAVSETGSATGSTLGLTGRP